MNKAQSKSVLPETVSLDQLRMLLGVNTSHINTLERQGIIKKTRATHTSWVPSRPTFNGSARSKPGLRIGGP
jgi:hypothetical protein